MARPLRIDLAGAWHHVTCRGNERRMIYRDDRDRMHFEELLGDVVERYLWRIHSFAFAQGQISGFWEWMEGVLEDSDERRHRGMARPLRIDLAGAWHHVTCRGNERRVIFRDDRDRNHFEELLGEVVERYLWRIHSFVMMDNHFHLEVETPEPNLSLAMQWLQVSYSLWFNRRHNRAGHLFQGRFKAILVEPDAWAIALSHYLHLNPVRTARHGLDKASRARQRLAAEEPPSREEVQARLECLRNYRWSSYRAYAGLAPAPGWLMRDWILERMGSGSEATRQRRYRLETEARIVPKPEDSPWIQVEAQALLGGSDWVQKIQTILRGDDKEQPSMRSLRLRPAWEDVVREVEAAKGGRWDEFRDRHGDWGRDLAIWLGRQCCGLKLAELGALVGSMDYRTVGWIVAQVNRRIDSDPKFARLANRVRLQIQKPEI